MEAPTDHKDKQKKSYFHRTREAVDPHLMAQWEEEQRMLRDRLRLEDLVVGMPERVAGVDISASKKYEDIAVATLVVLDFKSGKILYQDSIMVKLQLPYVPGLLAFRELGPILELFKRLKQLSPELFPDVILTDGNGILHCNGFGLASHLGVLLDTPTIGCGKTMFYIDGLSKQKLAKIGGQLQPKQHKILVGQSGKEWGAALRPNEESKNPIIISQGNLISLPKAVEIVRAVCIYRVPEPIRQADKLSRRQIENVSQKELTKIPCYDLTLNIKKD